MSTGTCDDVGSFSNVNCTPHGDRTTCEGTDDGTGTMCVFISIDRIGDLDAVQKSHEVETRVHEVECSVFSFLSIIISILSIYHLYPSKNVTVSGARN